MNRNIELPTTSTIGVHLLVNLYKTVNATVKTTAAIPDCATLAMASSTGFVRKSRSVPWTLDLRILKLITVMTPTTAPQSPSKKLERNLRRVNDHDLRSTYEGHCADTYLVVNQLLKQRMTSNGEQEAWKKHTQGYDTAPANALPNPPSA